MSPQSRDTLNTVTSEKHQSVTSHEMAAATIVVVIEYLVAQYIVI